MVNRYNLREGTNDLHKVRKARTGEHNRKYRDCGSRAGNSVANNDNPLPAWWRPKSGRHRFCETSWGISSMNWKGGNRRTAAATFIREQPHPGCSNLSPNDREIIRDPSVSNMPHVTDLVGIFSLGGADLNHSGEKMCSLGKPGNVDGKQRLFQNCQIFLASRASMVPFVELIAFIAFGGREGPGPGMEPVPSNPG